MKDVSSTKILRHERKTTLDLQMISKFFSFTDFGILSAGRNKAQIKLYYVKILNTLFVSFLGGRSHVGALSAALWPRFKKLKGTLKIPGHRDDVITRDALDFLLKKARGPVVVTAGIHYDKIRPAQIQKIVANSRFLCKELAARLS